MAITDTSEPEIERAGEDRARLIRDRLRNAIIDRRLVSGAKLAEAEVGALFDVSRTIARSALQMLAFEGLVRIERNRGAFVADPPPAEARQVFAARRLIEPAIVAAVCAGATSRDLARLRKHLTAERRHMNQPGAAARRAEIKASGDFHLMLATIGGNAILHRFMEELVARSSLVISLYGRTGASSCGHDEHARIVEAIAGRDASAAQTLVLRHIEHIEADLDLRTRGELPLREALDL